MSLHFQSYKVVSFFLSLTKDLPSGSKGGDNGSNIQFLGVSDFGDWLKGNVQEFSSFWLSLGTCAWNAATRYVCFEYYRRGEGIREVGAREINTRCVSLECSRRGEGWWGQGAREINRIKRGSHILASSWPGPIIF